MISEVILFVIFWPFQNSFVDQIIGVIRSNRQACRSLQITKVKESIILLSIDIKIFIHNL